LCQVKNSQVRLPRRFRRADDGKIRSAQRRPSKELRKAADSFGFALPLFDGDQNDRRMPVSSDSLRAFESRLFDYLAELGFRLSNGPGGFVHRNGSFMTILVTMVIPLQVLAY
jgi:hypothetical protein